MLKARQSAPLRRSTQIKTRRGQWPAKRAPIKPVSDKRRAERVERAAIVERVLERADGRCFARSLGTGVACVGALSVHEVSKRSRKPGCHLDESDCVALCWLHQGWVEDHPLEAHALGLAKHAWET
jgi:hypothetical protein